MIDRAFYFIGTSAMVLFPDDKILRCGYGWASTEWLQKTVGLPEPFIPACAMHDALYETKSGSRKDADRILLEGMLRNSYSLWDRTRAYLFYGVVRLFAGPIWRDTN